MGSDVQELARHQVFAVQEFSFCVCVCRYLITINFPAYTVLLLFLVFLSHDIYPSFLLLL